MVQELHVLKCFSCETFQSYIVKKTNKWECKVCGTKQSIKKVYGRGSGKDCRLHTQKLNALKGEKEENKIPEVSEIEWTDQLMVDNGQNSLDSGSIKPDIVTCAESSKWAAYVDESDLCKSKSNVPTQDRICAASEPDVENQNTIKTRKRTFGTNQIGNLEEFSDSFKSYDVGENENYSVIPKYSKTAKYSNISENSLNSNVNNKSNNEEEVIESRKNLNKQNVKVSEKWAKYLEEDLTEEDSSVNSPGLSVSNGSWGNNIEDENILNPFRCSSLSKNNFKDQTSLDKDKNSLHVTHPSSSLSDSVNIQKLNVKKVENSDSEFKNHQIHNIDKAYPRFLQSTPVFEQNSELNDSDFLLDF